ncbi:MAG: twin-arginine translocation signal domain-containing protein [Planctomycetaceae bacterium]|nr:twin-arginine translocation signal domain-containing protein [Planctomycetaceae bacterium]
MTEIERREFLKNAGAALAGVAGVGVLTNAGCNKQSEIRNPSREELVKRLEKLAKSEPPKNLMQGATCYEIAMPPVVEKPCPDCGRTMIVGEKDEILREYNVPLKRIQDQGVNAKLIVPEHCPECGFGLKEAQFQLEIKYPDRPIPVRVELKETNEYVRIIRGVNNELELMALFLQGKDRYVEWHGEEKPLKDEVERLRELFGIGEEP